MLHEMNDHMKEICLIDEYICALTDMHACIILNEHTNSFHCVRCVYSYVGEGACYHIEAKAARGKYSGHSDE